jgi:hypothetical protein
MSENEIEGFDLVDSMPDYSKSIEENKKIFAEKYKKVYGVYPEGYEEK